MDHQAPSLELLKIFKEDNFLFIKIILFLISNKFKVQTYFFAHRLDKHCRNKKPGDTNTAGLSCSPFQNKENRMYNPPQRKEKKTEQDKNHNTVLKHVKTVTDRTACGCLSSSSTFSPPVCRDVL